MSESRGVLRRDPDSRRQNYCPIGLGTELLTERREWRMSNEEYTTLFLLQSQASRCRKKMDWPCCIRLARPKRERLFFYGACPALSSLEKKAPCPAILSTLWKRYLPLHPFLPPGPCTGRLGTPARYPLSATLQWVRSSKLQPSGWLASLPLPRFPYWATPCAQP